MPPLFEINPPYQYQTLERQDLPEGRRYVCGDQKLPSVTTILGETKEDKESLLKWVERVGQAEADRIRDDAAQVGTYMHLVIEEMLADRPLPVPTDWQMIQGYSMGYKLIHTYFKYLNEVWGSEVMLYYPDKYAGTTDLVGVYRDKPCIVDFKQSNKPKRRQWIEDYFCQLAAYALAHNELHGTDIDHAIILMAVRNGTTAEFGVYGKEFQKYKDMWLRRVDQFYKGLNKQE
jgi:hypothetical protein